MRSRTGTAEPAALTPARRGIIVASAVIIMMGLMTFVHVTHAGALEHRIRRYRAALPPSGTRSASLSMTVALTGHTLSALAAVGVDTRPTGYTATTSGFSRTNPSISGHAYNDAVSGFLKGR